MARQSGDGARVIPFRSPDDEAQAFGPNERRSVPRRRVLKAALAAYQNRHCTIPCTLRDITAIGARLRSEHAQNIPNSFELIVEIDGLVARCEVVWRKGNDLGVRFLGAPHKEAPLRQQVVNAATRNGVPSLRRTPKPNGA